MEDETTTPSLVRNLFLRKSKRCALHLKTHRLNEETLLG